MLWEKRQSSACLCVFHNNPYLYETDPWRDSELARSAVLGFLRSINSQGGECVATDVRENETRGAGPIKRKWASTGGRRNLGYSSPSSGYAANLCILCLYFCRSRARNDARARTCMRSRIRGAPAAKGFRGFRVCLDTRLASRSVILASMALDAGSS